MPSNASRYLRALRREWGLSQIELADLMPNNYRERVSKVERGEWKPNAIEIVAFKLIFDMAPEAMLADFYDEVEEAVLQRAYLLYQRLGADTSPQATRKRKLIARMLERAAVRNRFKSKL